MPVGYYNAKKDGCLYCCFRDKKSGLLDDYVRKSTISTRGFNYWVSVCDDHEADLAALLLKIEGVG